MPQQNLVKCLSWIVIAFASFLIGEHDCVAVQAPPFDIFADGEQEALQVNAGFKIKEGTLFGNLYVDVLVGEGYHTYSQNHGGSEISTRFEVPISNQFEVIGNFQPDREPHAFEKEGKNYEEFEGAVTWTAPFKLTEGVDPNNLLINVKYRGQVCDANSCQPPENLSLDAAFGGYDSKLLVRQAESGFDPVELAKAEEVEKKVRRNESPEELAALAALYDVDSKIKYERLDGSSGIGNFWTALFGAFVGGMILNLMPCVFPVLGLKVMGFVEQAGSDPRKIRMHGVAFALGLIFSMWVLAGVILGIKAFSGNDVNWGQQMGNPYFVGAIVILLFVLGLNLAGVFEMGLFMTRLDAGGGGKSKGYGGSFFSGILTTLVATPCSGPFLGAAMGYTLSQPPAIAMFLFTIFGLGIAFPYLVMAFFPSLIKCSSSCPTSP